MVLRSPRAVAVLLALLALASYANALSGEFVLDDGRAVVNNRCVVEQPGPACAFTSDFWGRPARQVGRTYRPLTVLSFALDWAWGNGRPWAFHLVNVLLHAGATLAVFALLLGLTRQKIWPSAAGAALFATMAVHTEAVAGIVGRADLLATLLVVGALTVIHRGLRAPADESRVRRVLTLALALALYAAGLLAHELAVLAPVLVLACDWASGRWPGIRRQLPLYAALGLVTAGYVVLRLVVLGRLVGPPPELLANPAVAASAGGRLLFALASFTRAARVILVPLNLSAEYGYAEVTVPRSVLDAEVLTGLALLGLLLLGVVLVRRSVLVAAGCGVLLCGLLLLSNGPVLLPTAFGERLLYLPSLGAAMVLGGLLEIGVTGAGHKAAIVALLVLGLGNLVIGLSRNRDWRDPVSLFESATRACPQSARAHLNLGCALNKAGRHADAVAPLRRAIAIYPELDIAAMELAVAYDLSGKPEQARPLFEWVYRRAPHDPKVVHNYRRFLRRRGAAGRRGNVVP